MKVLAIVVAVLVGLGALTGVGAYNTLVQRQEGVRQAWAQVQNVLRRRYDLIPNLVSTVKGYATHEQQVLEEITRLRSQWGAANTDQEQLTAATQLEGALGRLMVVLENYPDLKANQSFLALQSELEGTENRIAVERMRYNQAIQQYNVAVRGFPSNLVARLTGFAVNDAYFQAGEEAQQAPQVQF